MTDECSGCRSSIGAGGRAYSPTPTSLPLRPDVIARQWLGTPFRHQGRGRDGIDCLGLLVVCCQAVGYPVEDFTTYERNPNAERLEQEMARQLGSPVSDLQPGYLVAMAFPRVTRHVGIVGEYVHGGLSLIHTCNKAGKVIEHRLDDKWLARIRSAYCLEATP